MIGVICIHSCRWFAYILKFFDHMKLYPLMFYINLNYCYYIEENCGKISLKIFKILRSWFTKFYFYKKTKSVTHELDNYCRFV